MKHIVALLASFFAVTLLHPAHAQTDGNATAYLPSCAAALDILQGRKPAADSPEAAGQLRRAAMCFNALNAVLNVEPYLQREYSACAPGNAQLTAAQALLNHTQLSARQIAEEAMKIAGKMCIYTNESFTFEEL